jgi:hypothetical protein
LVVMPDIPSGDAWVSADGWSGVEWRPVAGVVLAGGSQPRRPPPGQTGMRPSTESRPLP